MCVITMLSAEIKVHVIELYLKGYILFVIYWGI